MTPYQVFDVSDWLVTDVEPVGDDVKYWLRGAAGEPDEQSWLFKEATLKEVPVAQRFGGGMRPYRQGEDWVEKVASELATLIGLPAARVELAKRHGVPGLISRDTKPVGSSLFGGGVLLAGVDERYKAKTDSDPRKNRVGHNLDNVEQVLAGVGTTPGWVLGDLTSLDQFAGYLLFDAWIANRDRHEFNWAVLRDSEGALVLSPSFDHGAALGSGLEDPGRERLVASSEVADWCARGTAHRMEDGADVTLLDLAKDALSRSSPTASQFWADRICAVEQPEWERILACIPGLSVVARTFTSDVLRLNQERIRNELRSD